MRLNSGVCLTLFEGLPIPVGQTIHQGIHAGTTIASEFAARMSAQTALTTFTLLCGILLIVFVEPPSKFWVGSHALRRDRRIVILALVMFMAYVLLLFIPPLRTLFDLTLLGFYDYLFIVLLVVLWVFAVRWAWRVRLLERFLS